MPGEHTFTCDRCGVERCYCEGQDDATPDVCDHCYEPEPEKETAMADVTDPLTNDEIKDLSSATLHGSLPRTMQSRLIATANALMRLRNEYASAELEVDHLRRENQRLTGWLTAIDGGDRPIEDAAKLHRMAYDAVVKRKPAPE